MRDLIGDIGAMHHLLGMVVETAEVKLVVADEDFRMRFISLAAAKFLKKHPDEFIGRLAEDILPPALAAERRRVNDDVLRSGVPTLIEEVLSGWRCWTTVFPAGVSRDGRRLIGILIRPVLSEVSEEKFRESRVAVRMGTGEMGPLAMLSKTETRVLQLLGHGLKTKEIAERMKRAPKTVEGHRYQIGKKLGASNRLALAIIAIRAGLAPLNPSLNGEMLDHGGFDGNEDD